jgi:hypothetical protein
MSEDLKKIYGKFFDESGNMKESGKSIVKEGMKGINKASAEKYVSKAPAIKAFDEATKAGPRKKNETYSYRCTQSSQSY